MRVILLILAAILTTAMAWPVFAQSDEPPAFGEVQKNVSDRLSRAIRLVRNGQYENALQLLDLALQESKQVLGLEHRITIESLNANALVLDQVGRSLEAERMNAEALRLSQTRLGRSDRLTLIIMDNYAGVLRNLGRGEEAEPLAAEALQLWTERYGLRDGGTLTSMHNYSLALLELGRAEEAEPIAAEALRLQRGRLGLSHVSLTFNLNGYASIIKALGRLEEAEPLYKQVWEMRRNYYGMDHPNTLTALNNYAELLVEMDRSDIARTHLAAALELRAKRLGEQHPDTLLSVRSSASFHLMAGEPERAVELAAVLSREARSRAKTLGSGGIRESSQKDREAADVQGVERLHADARWALCDGGLCPNGGSSTEAFTSLQIASAKSASRSVVSAAAERYAASVGLRRLVEERAELVRTWTILEAETIALQSDLTADSSARLDEVRNRLATIEARIAEIDAKLEADAPQYFSILNQQAVEIEDLRDVLKPDEAVLMLVPTERGTHCLVVSADAAEWSRSDLDEAELGAKVTAFRKGLEVKADEALPLFDFDLAHELYAELIAPVESALEGKSRVYVVADGPLSRIPLGTLITAPLEGARLVAANDDADRQTERDPQRTGFIGAGRSGAQSQTNNPDDFRAAQWLADRYALVTLPSLQSLVYIRTFGGEAAASDGAGYTGFGDPVLAGYASRDGQRAAGVAAIDAADLVGKTRGAAGGSLMSPASLKRLSSLPGTKRELELVSGLLGASDASLFLGEKMTEPAIRTADLSQTRILHLATHGLTSEEGGRLGELAEPGLVFTPPEQSSAANDGYLAASEVVGLDLTLAEWVILSACNTAAPSGKPGETGLSGLAQAFFYAGAESLLVSHWPVFDRIAPVLTAETLKRSEAGMSRAEALQAAMQEVRKTNPHPAAWAPFVLVGEGL